MRRRHRAEHPIGPGRRRVEQRQRRRRKLAQTRTDPRTQIIQRVVGSDLHVHRQGDPRTAPGQRDLGDDHRGRGEPLPSGRPASVSGKPEAPDRHEPGSGRPVQSVGQGIRGNRRPSPGNLTKPAGASCLDRPHAPDPRHRIPVAVGLLEAEPRLARASRGHPDRCRIDPRRDRSSDAGQHRRAGPPRAPERCLQPPLEPADCIGIEPAPGGRNTGCGQRHARRLPRPARSTSRYGHGRSRSRRCGPSRSARTAGRAAQRRRPCRTCR